MTLSPRLAPFAILLVGALIAAALVMTAPRVEPLSPERVPPLVRALEIKPRSL